MIRVLLFVVMIAGLGIGVAYPWYVNNFTGSEIGRYPVLANKGDSFGVPQVALVASDAPVRVFVDMVPLPGYIPSETSSSLTIAVSRDGHPILSKGLAFSANSTSINRDRPQDGSPLRQSAGDIDPVIPGTYAFYVAPGLSDGLQVSKIDLVLRRSAQPVPESYISAGLMMAVLGFYGLMRTRLRRKAI